MKTIPIFFSGLLALIVLGGCTARDEQLVKELENMPGITCTDAGIGDPVHCGPDSLSATETPS